MATKLDSNRSATSAWVVLVAVLVLGGFLLKLILETRYETGESYPEYSSMRTDPLGTKALLEAVDTLPGVAATRNFSELKHLQGRPGKTLLLCGLTAEKFNQSSAIDAKSVALFAVNGGRVVVALHPKTAAALVERLEETATKEAKQELEEEKSRAKKKEKNSSGTQDSKTSSKPAEGSCAATFKLNAKPKEFVLGPNRGQPLVLSPTVSFSAVEAPKWFSNDSFAVPEVTTYLEMKDLPHPASLNIVATKSGQTMVLERRLGAGSIVLCSDRFFLSNEALWKDPKPAFLSWLLGNAKEVIFEETHFGYGIGDSEGIMTLARRYKMHGLFLGGFFLFILGVWRQASGLVPSAPEDHPGNGRDDTIAGQSATAGLEGLLRRGVPSKRLLRRCWEVWENTKATSSTVPEERRALARTRIDATPESSHGAPLYRELTTILHRKP